MDNTVSGIILEVSRQLNDQDDSGSSAPAYFRWPREDLLEYLNDALIQVSNLRPDVLITSGLLPTAFGTLQSLPSGITELISVDYATVAGCPDQVPLTRVDLAFAKSFYRASCLTAPFYRPYNWAYEAANPTKWFIYPSIPGGVSVSVQGTYRGETPQFATPGSIAAIPFGTKYHQAIVSWMQARAYEVDQESESSFKLAMQHRADFYKLMDTMAKADQSLHNGTMLAPGRRR